MARGSRSTSSKARHPVRRLLIFPEPTSPGPSSIYVVGTDGSGMRQVTPEGLGSRRSRLVTRRIDDRLRINVPTPLALRARTSPIGASRSIRPDGGDLRDVVLPENNAITPSWTAGGSRNPLRSNERGRVQAIRTSAPDGSAAENVATFQTPKSSCIRSSGRRPERLRRIRASSQPAAPGKRRTSNGQSLE